MRHNWVSRAAHEQIRPTKHTEDEDIIDARVVPDKQVDANQAGENDRHHKDAVDEEQAAPGRYRCSSLGLEACGLSAKMHAKGRQNRILR